MNPEDDSPKLLTLVAFTDPACTWCWGSEPMLRDDRNGIGGEAEQSNAAIARHYVEAASPMAPSAP